MAQKVFKYGALPPVRDGDIRRQMQLGRDYYNSLVEEENKRRMLIWGGEKMPDPPHIMTSVLDEEKEEFCTCTECKTFWREMSKGFAAASEKLGYIDTKPLRKKASEQKETGEKGLYWGTYLLVERAFSKACKDTKWTSKVRFRSWKLGGYIGVQIQNSASPDSFFVIEPAHDPRTGRKAGQRHTIKVRVGTDDKRPIWSDPLAFEMHRPLQGKPTWVQICLNYRGTREEWSVNITCKNIPGRVDGAVEGAVAIDVGWRVLEDGRVRIAYARGDEGNEYELTLPAVWLAKGYRADRIRKARDLMFNIIKKRCPVLGRHKKPRAARERVLRENLNTDIELEGWRLWDKHMEDYELGCRQRSVNTRRDAVRVWLRMLRRRYQNAIVKDSDHKKMKDHKRAVADGMSPRSRRSAHHVAPGELMEEIHKVFGRMQGVAVVEAMGTTAICPECGGWREVGSERVVLCEWCGAEEDRDRASTRNMLSLYLKGSTGKPTPRKITPKFARKHKKKGVPQESQRDGL